MNKVINILIITLLSFTLKAQIGITSNDNSLLATLVYEQGQNFLHIYDLNNGHLNKKISVNFDLLSKASFTHSDKYLVILSHKTLYVFDVASGRVVRKFYQTADFCLSDNDFLSVISNSYPYVLNLSDLKQTRYSLAVGKIAQDILISHDARYLAVITQDKMVYVYYYANTAPLDVFHGQKVFFGSKNLVILRKFKNNLQVTSYTPSPKAITQKTVFDAAQSLQSCGLSSSSLAPDKSLVSPDGKLIALYLEGNQDRKVIIFDTQTGSKKAQIDNSNFPLSSIEPIAWNGTSKLILSGQGLNGLEYDMLTGIITPLHWQMYNPNREPALLPREQTFKRRFSPDYHLVVMPVYEGPRRFLLVRDAMVDKRQISYADANFIAFSHDSRQLYMLIQGIVFQLNTSLIRQAMLEGRVAKLSQLGTAVYGQITEKFKPKDDNPPANYHYLFTQKTLNVTDLDTQKLYVLLRGMNLDPKNVAVKLNLIDDQGHIITGATNPQWLYLWCNLLLQNKSLKVDQKNFVVKEVHETQPTAYALVLDHSGSMGNQRANALQFGAWQLIKNKKPQDAFLLIKYDDHAQVVVNLTTNPSPFFAPLDNKGLQGFGGGTALNDATYLAIEKLAKAANYKHKVIFLFTDGYENASQHTKDQVIRAAIHNKIEIFTIGFGRSVNEQYLEDMAYNTGGAFYHIYHTSELRKIFLDVDMKRRYYYTVNFITNYPGKYIALLQLCQNFQHHDSLVLSFTNTPTVPPEKHHIQVDPKLTPQQRQALKKKTVPCRPPTKPVHDPAVVAEFNQIHFPNILFAFDSDRIIRSEQQGLNEIAAFMKRHPQVYLMVEGYTDSIGSFQYNLDLSRRRAQAAKRLLVAKGIAPGRIFTRGYGENRPVASNATDQGRARNRRIEFHIFKY